MDILSNIKGGVRFLSLPKRTWIFKCWGKHVFLKDANQLQDNERVKGRKGSRDNFYNSGFRLMVTWITMQMAKASNFCQLAKYPEDLLVARALLPSLLCQHPEQWPRSFRADGRSPSRQGLVSHTLSLSLQDTPWGWNFPPGQQRYQHVPPIHTGNIFFSTGHLTPQS